MRTVNIVEVDNRIGARGAFEIHFISDNVIKVMAKLSMGTTLLSLVQHWLEHDDELFADVFSGLNESKVTRGRFE